MKFVFITMIFISLSAVAQQTKLEQLSKLETRKALDVTAVLGGLGASVIGHLETKVATKEYSESWKNPRSIKPNESVGDWARHVTLDREIKAKQLQSNRLLRAGGVFVLGLSGLELLMTNSQIDKVKKELSFMDESRDPSKKVDTPKIVKNKSESFNCEEQ